MNALVDFPDYSLEPNEQKAHYSEVIEMAVLGCVLAHPETIAQVKTFIQPEDFYFQEHRQIYVTMLALKDDEILPEQIAVAERLKQTRAISPEYDHMLAEIGGRVRLMEIGDAHCRPQMLQNNLAQMWNYAALRKTQKELTNTQRDLNADNPNVIDIRSRLVSKLQEIARKQDDSPYKVADLSMSVFEDLEKRASGEVPVGIKVQFGGLDALTQGFEPGSLILVAGRPAMGKTMFAFNMLHNICKYSKKTAAFFSCEMLAKPVFERLLSRESKVLAKDIRAGKLDSEAWSKIADALGRISDYDLFIFDNSHGINYVEGIDARLHQLDSAGKLPSLIAVDYVQIMMSKHQFNNRNLEIGTISMGMKQLALKWKLPVILLSQLSRPNRDAANKRPILTDLRDSGTLEQDCDVCIFLHRDEYYNPESQDKGLAEVIVAKNRNGEPGTVVLEYHPEYQSFYDSDLNPNQLLSRQAKDPKPKWRGKGREQYNNEGE